MCRAPVACRSCPPSSTSCRPASTWAGPSSPTSVADVRDRLRSALKAAMKDRDKTAVAALRSALGAIDNAEAVDPAHAPKATSGVIAGAAVGLNAGEVPRLELTEERVVDIVRAEIAERTTAAEEYERLGQTE